MGNFLEWQALWTYNDALHLNMPHTPCLSVMPAMPCTADVSNVSIELSLYQEIQTSSQNLPAGVKPPSVVHTRVRRLFLPLSQREISPGGPR